MAKQAVKKGAGVKKNGIEAFKERRGLNYKEGDNVTITTGNAEKEMRFLIMPKAFTDAVGIHIPLNTSVLLAGHSNSGKTSIMMHLIAAAQNGDNLCPVIFDTENNFDFSYAIACGMQAEPVYGDVEVEHVNPETAEVTITKERKIVNYKGNFVYFNNAILAETYGSNDYTTGKSNGKPRKVAVIEDIAYCINEMLTAQDEGEIDTGLVFLWDSIGSIGCWKSYKSSCNNAMWDAAALSVSFSGIINDRIPRGRRISSKYDNGFIATNKIWLDAMKNPMPGAPPSLALKGGVSMLYGARLIVQTGKTLTSGVKRLTATSKGKNYTWGILTTLKTIKNQLSEPYSITREGEVIVTPHGLIGADKDSIEEYKRVHMSKIIKELQQLTGDASITEKDVEYTEEDAED